LTARPDQGNRVPTKRDVEQIVGRERRERVSQLAWCGEGCFDSRRRVNSTVGRFIEWVIKMTQYDLAKILIAVLLASGPVIITFLLKLRFDKEVAKKAGQRIAQAESKVEAEPEKAKPAWDLARATLEAYFNRNLSQITSIFWLSVIVMVIGFAIIVGGIIKAFQDPDVLGPAGIAATCGLITEFIGATFLFIYRSTIQQAIDYSQTLERINSVGMAMQILDTMPDQTKSDDLKSQTKATLVELLVKQAYGVGSTKSAADSH
jgi:hypothetical protein